eukprot:5708780-Pleurochrysis_carterae.AAC.4
MRRKCPVGCRFFVTTPPDLIDGRLYKDNLAVSICPMPHREVSLAIAARTLSTHSVRSGWRRFNTPSPRAA